MPATLAPRTYLAGELIHREEPFAQILPRLLKDKFCESCHCRSFNLRFCKQCLAVKYCGKACQKKDWKIHRIECKNMKYLTDERGDDMVRMLGRVILKIKGKEWKDIKTTVLGTEVSFDDIDPHYKEMTEDPIRNLLYKELKERTKQFIGVENTPSDIDMLKIVGKVIYNSFLNAEKEVPGVCFFLGMFLFEHQCIPNSSFTVIQNNLKIWANKKIVKNSEKISVSYRRLFELSLNFYEETDGKACKCTDCSLPFGESMLSKILDEKKAFSLISHTQKLLKVGKILEKIGTEEYLKGQVDEVLEKHNGVLGRTNLLHLKLLGFRCLEIGGTAYEVERPLLELESIMKSMYGEFSVELLRIYETLAIVYINLGHLILARSYYGKAKRLTEPF